MSSDDFQTKYASVMESMLKTAIAETTKLFETMVNELKAEISSIKKENEELKTRCSQFENARSQATVYTRESEPLPERSDGSEKRDTAVQCDLVPFRTMPVEQCQPLRHSPLQNQEQQCTHEETEYTLQEHDYGTREEGNSQMEFILLKQKDSVLKKEEIEPTVVYGQVSKNIAGSPLVSECEIENEGPLINRECSTGEIPFPQRHEEIQVDLELPCLGPNNNLQESQNQSAELEHSLVMSLAAIKDDMEQESEVGQKISEIGTQGELLKSPKKLMVAHSQSEVELLEKEQSSVLPQPCQREGKMSVNEKPDVTLQQCANLQSTEKQFIQSTPLNKGEAYGKLKYGVAEGDASSQPDLSVRHRRGRPPKKAKHLQPPVKKVIQSPSSDVPTEQEVKNDPTKNMEEVDITSFESPQVSLVQPEGSTSFITPSVQERGNSKVISLALSVASLSRICSSEKEKTPESQQFSMENEEGVIKAPSTSVFSAIETLNPLPAESHEPRERYTSVTLQDAMLLVEAMNQSTVENTFSSLERMATPYQTQCSLQTVDKVPVKPDTLLLPVETYEAVGNVPVTVLSTTTQSTKEELTTSHTTDITPTNEDFAHIKVVIAKEPHTVTLSNTATSSTATAATQTIVQSLQRHPPRSQITLVAPSKQGNALPHKIIVVPRPVSSLMHHKIAVQSPNQLPSVVSTAVAEQSNSVLPVSMASGLPLGTPSLSSVLQKSIYIKSRKSLPLDTSQSNATSADLQSGTPSHPKITIIIPRHVSAVASKKHQSQTIALATKQESSKSAAPVTVLSSQSISLSQELSISMAAQTASDEVATISCEKWDNTFDYLKSPKPTASVSETISEPTETPTSLSKSVGLVPTSISPVVQPTSEKTSAVVTLTRLPFTISAKESVLLSGLPTNGSYGTQSILKEGTTQEKSIPVVISTQPSETLVLSTDICSDLQETSVAVSVNTSQLSDVPTDIQEKASLSSKNCTVLEESPDSWYVQPSILSAPVFENSTIAVNATEPSAVSGISGENTSHEEEEIICIPVDDCALPNPPVEQKQSAAVIHLTSITSKDTSDPHLQMTKTQFLAKLAVSPVEDPKKASSNDPVEARASCAETSTSNKKRLQRNTLVAQLRNHLKTHFQARRTETKQEPCTEIETCTVSPKKLRLEKDGPNDGDTSIGPIPCSTKSQATVEDVTSLKKTTYHPTPISPRRSGLCKDGSRSRRTFSEPTYVSFRKSKGKSESTLVSPRRSSSIKESAGPKKAKTTYVNSKRSNSIQESASPKKTRNPSVHHSRSGSTGDGASTKKPQNGSLNNTKTTPVRPKRAASPKKTKSTSVSPTMSNLSKNGTSPKMSTSELTISRRRCTLSNDGSGIKRIKRKSNSLSARRCSITTDGASTKNAKSKTSTPDVRWPKLAKDGDNPRKTGESTLAKKPRLIQDVTSPKKNLRVVNAKKIAKTAKAKALSKLKNSNQSKLQNGAKTSQLAENSASCVAVKRCTAKAVWTPPRLAASKPPPAGERASPLFSVKKETRSQNHTVVYPPSVSLHPIPVKAPPVVSPLQPLSVIGRRLLKNQCGECGRILSSSAALESHVSLHTGRRPFSCTLCGKHFSDSKGIKRHGRVHRNGRIHICQQCGKGFVYRFGLTKHLQMVHGRIKPFVCQICNKGFFTKRDVEAHVRIHTGEKPFHCNLCEKKFTRRVELNVHLRWHNGEKRHWCPYCGKGFLDLNNLKRHKYTHTGEKPHSCPHCPKHFTQSGHLKKHVKNVHKIQ